MSESKHPLVLVFYVGRYLLEDSAVFKQFTESVDFMIKERGYDMMCFFVPTDGIERIECINPVQLSETDINDVYSKIDFIRSSFDMGEG